MAKDYVIAYHLKALQYEEAKYICGINEMLKMGRKSPQIAFIHGAKSVMGFWKKVKYHLNAIARQIDYDDSRVKNSVKRKERENKSLIRLKKGGSGAYSVSFHPISVSQSKKGMKISNEAEKITKYAIM